MVAIVVAIPNAVNRGSSKSARFKILFRPKPYGLSPAQGLKREKLFWGPVAVDVDDECRVFVVESACGRIQAYRKISPYFTGTRL